jgi:hypothetical protein
MTPHHRFGNTEGAFEIYDRIKSFGADIHAVLGDGFKDSGVGWPGDNNDWTLWENYVENLVSEALLSGYNVAWDIWNEANVENYWNPAGTAVEKKLRFFETWKRAWLMIKALDPNAIIVGPGNSAYLSMPNRLFSVEEFLIFARDNGVLPDILSWHVWDEDTIIPDTNRARTFIADNNINIEKISISEYGGRSQHTMPGVFVWYFANLEQAGVDMAMRACSVDPNGCSTCWNVSLDGLLTLPELEPRSTWWVYKSYADMTGTLVKVTGDNNINGLAAKDSDAGSVLREPKAIILLGKRSGTITDVSVLLTGLENVSYIKNCGGNVRLIIEHIPDSGWESLSEPIVINDQVIPLSDTMNLVLPDFGPTDAYVITIRNPNFYKSDFDTLVLLSSNWLNDNSSQQNCVFNTTGDLTEDCKVNFDDFGVMALYWCQQ